MTRKKKAATTLRGKVQKIIPDFLSIDSEQAEIEVERAEPLYREIRIENKLQDEEGKEVGLKPDAQVDVTIEAEPQETTPKRPPQSQSGETKREPDTGKR
jgi:hypothetical protein